MEKPELLRQISSAHDRLFSWLSRVAPEQGDRPWEDGWSPRNILAHIIAHEQVLLEFLISDQGRKPQSNTAIKVKELEQRVQQEYEQHPYMATLTDWEGSYHRVVQSIENLPPAAWINNKDLNALIATSTYGHYDEHLAQVRTHLLGSQFSLRPATENDWAVILQVANQSMPGQPPENLLWLEGRKNFPAGRFTRRHYLVSDLGGKELAYGTVEGSENGWYHLFIIVDPSLFPKGPADLLYDRLMSDLRELGAQGAWCRVETGSGELLNYLLSCGFVEYRRSPSESRAEVIALRRALPDTCFAIGL